MNGNKRGVRRQFLPAESLSGIALAVDITGEGIEEACATRPSEEVECRT